MKINIDSGLLFAQQAQDLATGIEYSIKGYYEAILAKDTFFIVGNLMQAGIIYRDWGKKDGKGFFYDSAFNSFSKAIGMAKTGRAMRFISMFIF